MMNEDFKNLNHLVLNFYPDGYSIAVKLNEFPIFTTETILETAKISYEETSLLNYIENEELPPLLVEIIDSSPKLSQYKIWQNGCLVLEIRDKININSNNCSDQNGNSNNISNDDGCCSSSSPAASSASFTSPSSTFVLLKPTNLSIINDVQKLTESSSWSLQDKLQLESQIVLYNSPPLYLDTQEETSKREQAQEIPMQQNLIDLSSIYTNCTSTTALSTTTTTTAASTNKRKYPFNDYSSNYSTSTSSSKLQRLSPQPPEPTEIDLPPELILQQFLATKREKKSSPAGHLVRFHRYKRHCKY